jgi:hypothetical protein
MYMRINFRTVNLKKLKNKERMKKFREFSCIYLFYTVRSETDEIFETLSWNNKIK